MKIDRYKPDHPVVLGTEMCPQIRAGVEADEIELRTGALWVRKGSSQWLLIGTRGVADVSSPPPRRGRPPVAAPSDPEGGL
jgi:hypothetical protein